MNYLHLLIQLKRWRSLSVLIVCHLFLKMVCTAAFSVVAMAVFIVRDQVLWIPGLILAAGTVAGASLSVKFAVSVAQNTLKWLLFVMVTLTCAGALFFG